MQVRLGRCNDSDTAGTAHFPHRIHKGDEHPIARRVECDLAAITNLKHRKGGDLTGTIVLTLWTSGAPKALTQRTVAKFDVARSKGTIIDHGECEVLGTTGGHIKQSIETFWFQRFIGRGIVYLKENGDG